MKTIANLLWLLTFGWITALFNLLIALLSFASLVFIPVGLQFLKLARFSLTPFGYDFIEEKASDTKLILNIVWAIFFGWEIMLGYFATALTLFLTIIFIPFGLQYLKVGIFVLMPLGKRVRRIS